MLVGCAGARIYTPPSAMPKLPCAIVMEGTDEESGEDIIGLICSKAGLYKLVGEYKAIDFWQKDAWEKCGPKDGKAKK